MNKINVIFLISGVFFLSANVNAGGKGEFKRELALEHFNKIDVNQSETIDRSELSIFVDQMFTAIDTNGDGEATKDEIKSHRENMKFSMKFSMLDKDNDGYISEDEMKAKSAWKRKRMFSKADSNDDGLLSKEELVELKKKHH
jgi:Ca2+-binding EF-hand superfamily protein